MTGDRRARLLRHAGALSAAGLCCLAAALETRAQTQAEMNRIACEEARRAETEVGELYTAVAARADAAAAEVRSKLAAAQEAWEAFRQAEIEARYPIDEPGHYGSVHPLCLCTLRTALARARSDQLRVLLEGAEGDVCQAPLPEGDKAGS